MDSIGDTNLWHTLWQLLTNLGVPGAVMSPRDPAQVIPEDARKEIEDTYAAAIKGASDYGLKVIEAARANTNAAFDFATQLMTVKSLSEMVELSTAHTRKQFEALTAQSKELAAIAQKVAADSAEPVKESFGKVFKKVA